MAAKKALSIEESLNRLDEIIRLLGEPSVTLDESLQYYTEGLKLSESCMKQLEEAEQKIEQKTVSKGEKV